MCHTFIDNVYQQIGIHSWRECYKTTLLEGKNYWMRMKILILLSFETYHIILKIEVCDLFKIYVVETFKEGYSFSSWFYLQLKLLSKLLHSYYIELVHNLENRNKQYLMFSCMSEWFSSADAHVNPNFLILIKFSIQVFNNLSCL